ncbi:MAG: alpha/beta hydrolase [Alphaproteobacteria bacterium]|nr:alpha/beta hydrolase [Alphaproteobacteria bacterium]
MQAPSLLALPGGRTLAYHAVAGRAPGLMFFGGFRSDMTGAKALALEAFCRKRGQAFLRFDYSGHGASSGAFEEGTIGAWLEDALAAFDALTHGPQLLAGSSMGAWIALLLALRRRERVRGIVGIAAAPDFTEELIWNVFPPAQRAQLATEGRVVLPDCYGTEPYAITRRLIEEGRSHLLLGESISLTCPVRLLHGLADEDVPWQTSARLLERLQSADATLTLIKGGGHRLSEPGHLQLLCETVAALSDCIRAESH